MPDLRSWQWILGGIPSHLTEYPASPWVKGAVFSLSGSVASTGHQNQCALYETEKRVFFLVHQRALGVKTNPLTPLTPGVKTTLTQMS